MATTNVNIRMEEDLKKQTEVILGELGLNMTTAMTMFAKTIVRENRIPLDLSLKSPNKETLEAMREVEDMRNGKIPRNTQSVESFFKELNIDVDR